MQRLTASLLGFVLLVSVAWFWNHSATSAADNHSPQDSNPLPNGTLMVYIDTENEKIPFSLPIVDPTIVDIGGRKFVSGSFPSDPEIMRKEKLGKRCLIAIESISSIEEMP